MKQHVVSSIVIVVFIYFCDELLPCNDQTIYICIWSTYLRKFTILKICLPILDLNLK
jgi:hypothetical protein